MKCDVGNQVLFASPDSGFAVGRIRNMDGTLSHTTYEIVVGDLHTYKEIVAARILAVLTEDDVANYKKFFGKHVQISNGDDPSILGKVEVITWDSQKEALLFWVIYPGIRLGAWYSVEQLTLIS